MKKRKRMPIVGAVMTSFPYFVEVDDDAATLERMMDEHIAASAPFKGVRLNTSYSYGIDDQEFVVAFEGDDPGEFLALVRELRGTDSTQYTLFDTPMFTCRRIEVDALGRPVQLIWERQHMSVIPQEPG